MRMLWFNDGKNWEILKTKELVDLPLAHPDQMICVSAIPASAVDLNFRLPSWLGWMKSLDVTMNWSLSATTFSMSLPRVLRRTIGQKAFGWSYNDLFGLDMTIVVNTLKYFGQYSRLMHASAILADPYFGETVFNISLSVSQIKSKWEEGLLIFDDWYRSIKQRILNIKCCPGSC